MIRLFCGYDRRQLTGLHVFIQSVLDTASAPVKISAIGEGDDTLHGSTEFVNARFMVPALCGYEGWAIFADGTDMIVRDDIQKLWAHRDPQYALLCVKHQYRTRHPMKFVGTPLEAPNVDYPRKNWSSLMLINCAAPEHRNINPRPGLNRMPWLFNERIGELPAEWNWLVDEFGEKADAKLLHWTAGNPGFDHYADAPQAGEWHSIRARLAF